MKKQKFTLIELLVVIAQFLCDFAEKAITVFADAKNVITRKFLERIEGVRGRKGEPFSKKVSLSLPAPFTLIELLVVASVVVGCRPNVGLGSGRLSSLRGVERTEHSEVSVKISQRFVQSLR